MHLIGFWIESLLDDRYFPPQELVGELPAEARECVAAYLDQGIVFKRCRGKSWCRFGCRHLDMGNKDLTDGTWVWPEGLGHYIRVHGVTLPDQFLNHVLGGGSRAPNNISDQIPSDELWSEWCRTTSSRHLQPVLADALARTNSRAAELREAHWKHRELEVGVSKTKCLQRDCPSKALAGMVLCAMHASLLDDFHADSAVYFEGLLEALSATPPI